MAAPVNSSIVEHFRPLEDPRIERTKKHNLLDILVIAVCTLLSGVEGFQDMELFGKSKRAWRQTFLALPHRMRHVCDVALPHVTPSARQVRPAMRPHGVL